MILVRRMAHFCYHGTMALIDTLYDILSGVGGTLFGVALTTAINYRRNKRITTLLADTQSRVASLASENNR